MGRTKIIPTYTQIQSQTRANAPVVLEVGAVFVCAVVTLIVRQEAIVRIVFRINRCTAQGTRAEGGSAEEQIVELVAEREICD